MAKKRKLSKIIWPFIFSAPFIIIYILFNLYPVIYSFILSLHSWNGIGAKEFVGFGNYIKIFTKDVLFNKSVGNTLLIAATATPVAIFSGLVLAYLLFNLKKGKRLLQTINFFPYITTPVAIGFVFSYLFDYSGGYVNQLFTSIGLLSEKYYWLENVWSARVVVMLMIIWRNLGYYMTIYLSGMTTISSEVYEASKIDGASKIQTFFSITIPLLKNTTVFLALTSVIGGLQLFDEPYQLYTGWTAGVVNVGGPKYSVLTVIWKFYDDSFKSNSKLGYGAAVSFSLFLIIFAISLLQLRSLTRKEDK